MDKYEKYCGNCSNLIKFVFNGKKIFCCSGNVDNPDKCSLAKKQYQIKVKGSIYTIPKENIQMLAMTKAMDLKADVELRTDEQAIKYLESLGIEVTE